MNLEMKLRIKNNESIQKIFRELSTIYLHFLALGRFAEKYLSFQL